jgi:hypothetical protein
MSFYSMEDIWLGILNAQFISLEIHGAFQFYFFFFFFFFQFYLKEEKEVEISEDLITKKIWRFYSFFIQYKIVN